MVKENESDFTEKEIFAFSFLIGKYYGEKVERIPIKRKIREKVKVKQPTEIVKKVDVGMGDQVKIVFLVVNLLAILSLAFSVTFAIILAIAGNIVGFVLSQKIRKYEEKIVTIEKEVEKEVEREIEDGYKEVKIPLTEKIVSLGRGSIPFNSISFIKDKVIVAAPKSLGINREINYPLIEDFRRFSEIMETMEKEYTNIPYVLDGEKGVYDVNIDTKYKDGVVLRGYEKELRDLFEEISLLSSAIKNISFNFYYLTNSPIYDFLIKVNEGAFNSSEIYNTIETLKNYVDSEEGVLLEDRIRDWISEWEKNQAILHAVRFSSLSKEVAPIAFDLSEVINYSAFNFYCPYCNKELSEELLNRDYSIQNDKEDKPIYFSNNTRCVYNPKKEVWVCPVCGKETKNPIPVHKVLDEILLPTYDKLMDENKNERIKAHTEIKNKVMEYTNEMEKEVETSMYDHMSKLLALSETMERLSAEIEGEKEAIDSIVNVAKEYKSKQSGILKEISMYGERVSKEISSLANSVIQKLEESRARELRSLNKELTYLSKVKKIEDERRDKLQRQILQANIEQSKIMSQGFNRLETSINKQTDVMSSGFNRLDNTMKSGFSSVNATMKTGFSSLNSTMKSGFSSVSQKISQGNAINAAIAKKQGINVRDYNPLLHPGKALRDATLSIGGMITGKSTMEVESKKLNKDLQD